MGWSLQLDNATHECEKRVAGVRGCAARRADEVRHWSSEGCSLGGPTGMALPRGSTEASWLCVPGFRRVCRCRPRGRGRSCRARAGGNHTDPPRGESRRGCGIGVGAPRGRSRLPPPTSHKVHHAATDTAISSRREHQYGHDPLPQEAKDDWRDGRKLEHEASVPADQAKAMEKDVNELRSQFRDVGAVDDHARPLAQCVRTDPASGAALTGHRGFIGDLACLGMNAAPNCPRLWQSAMV